MVAELAERRTLNQRSQVQISTAAVSKLESNFVHPTLPVSFGLDMRSRWSLCQGK